MLGYRLFSVLSPKAAKFFRVRSSLLKEIKRSTLETPEREGTRYWFHCASVGEFEQARSLIEKIREREEGATIIVTFFSSSGYEMRSNYPLADHIFYLPVDTRSNARKFLEYIKPDIAIFIKYEYWPNFLAALHKRSIPIYMVSANFMMNQPFFHWWGGFFRDMLKKITHFFVQDVASENFLAKIGLDNVTVSGDTRFDRVASIVEESQEIEELELFTSNTTEEYDFISVLIAGSTWPKDEKMLFNFMGRFREYDYPRIKLIIAPHQLNGGSSVESIQSLFSSYKVVTYSSVHGKLSNSAIQEQIIKADIFIMDVMGILSASYRYGSFAYVGGGFGAGIHNILEPAAFGLPVVFGPNNRRFMESYGLLACGGGFEIVNLDGYMSGRVDVLTMLAVNKLERSKASTYARWYVEKYRGATETIWESIKM